MESKYRDALLLFDVPKPPINCSPLGQNDRDFADDIL